MLHYFKSERGKLRDHARNWLYLAKKVHHYRKDELGAADADALARRIDEVKARLKSPGEDGGKLKFAMENLKGQLEKVGGSYYPRSSLSDNVEFFFVAIIIYVGVTTFFVKPFKIPTNSMWPTYYGMTGEVYKDPADSPNVVEKAARLLAFGARHYDIKSPADGELMLPLAGFNSNGWAAFFEPATARRYFILPTPGRRITLRVGDARTSFKYMADFNVESDAISPILAESHAALTEEMRRRVNRRAVEMETVTFDQPDGSRRREQIAWVRTGKHYKKGETILSFDLMTGDQLFVERMSYHFAAPEVGEGFVFKTSGILGLEQNKFYIKRLAGTPGDEVRIAPPALLVNGAPASGSKAFELNASQTSPYRGYINIPSPIPGHDLSEPTVVPPDSYLALGDNSSNSLDGRAWGFVPAENVVGRPIMIYYPFTRRFGPAK